MSKEEVLVFDDNYEDWKVGDSVVWEGEKDGPVLLITHMDHGYVFWKEENGHEGLTRTASMFRVIKKVQTKSDHPSECVEILQRMMEAKPYFSDRMCEVLCLFFNGEYPFRIYSTLADGNEQEDRAFDVEIKELKDYFSSRRKARP